MNLDKYYSEEYTRKYLQLKKFNVEQEIYSEEVFDNAFTAGINQGDPSDYEYSKIEQLLDSVVLVGQNRAYVLDVDSYIEFLRTQILDTAYQPNNRVLLEKEIDLINQAKAIGSQKKFHSSIEGLITKYNVEIEDENLFYIIVSNLLIEMTPIAKIGVEIHQRIINNIQNQQRIKENQFSVPENSDLNDFLKDHGTRSFKELFDKSEEAGINARNLLSDDYLEQIRTQDQRRISPATFFLNILDSLNKEDTHLDGFEKVRFVDTTLEQTFSAPVLLDRDAFVFDLFSQYVPEAFDEERIKETLKLNGYKITNTNIRKSKGNAIKKYLNYSVFMSHKFSLS